MTSHLIDLTRTFQVPPARQPQATAAAAPGGSGPACSGRYAGLTGCDPAPATAAGRAASAGSGPSAGPWLTIGLVLLTVINVAQAGLDPATDGLEIADAGALATDEAGAAADDAGAAGEDDGAAQFRTAQGGKEVPGTRTSIQFRRFA